MLRSKNYKDIKVSKNATIKTGDETLDTFLSNEKGFVDGSAIFLTGTQGAGKTTFTYVLQKLMSSIVSSFYSREMGVGLLTTQMKRYAISHKNAYVADKESCPNIDEYIKEIDALKPRIVIVDSLQVILKEDFPTLGIEAAAYEIVQKLRAWTTKNNAVLIVVGHVTKSGEFEGRNTIPHMFDAHLEMKYDKKKELRTISWAKNRFGETSTTLFYKFGKNKIDFSSRNTERSKSLEELMEDSILSFLGTIDKTVPNYELFRKEFIKAVHESKEQDYFTKCMECLKTVKELQIKYNL